MEIGDNVIISQNAQTLLGLPHQDGYVIHDILKFDVKFPIVLKHEEMGKDWVEFFDEDELVKE